MSIYYQDERLTLLHGDAIEQVRTLDAGSVQTVVTSPPYFGLRDYGEDGQYGAEATVGEFVERLVALFREIRRVLADDGTVWLNLGDSYGAGKQLLGVPWRVAFALQEDGWVLRSDIIWHKPAVMPESVTDRPTRSHEHLFLLAASPAYYYDAESIREEERPETRARYAAGYKAWGKAQFEGSPTDTRKAKEITPEDLGHREGRNKRDVWTITPARLAVAHFATFPPDLVRPCILAGSRPGDTVLDPFSGSGTTGMVALQEGRKYVGIDLNAEYLDLSLRERFAAQPLDIFGATA